MRKIRLGAIGILMMLTGVYSCDKERDPYLNAEDYLFIGYWKESHYTDSAWIFTREDKLADDQYAFGILSDGMFIENKNISWCGTPPVVYSRYEGTWLEKSPDTLWVNTPYWGGDMQFFLIIKSVTRERIEVIMETPD